MITRRWSRKAAIFGAVAALILFIPGDLDIEASIPFDLVFPPFFIAGKLFRAFRTADTPLPPPAYIALIILVTTGEALWFTLATRMIGLLGANLKRYFVK